MVVALPDRNWAEKTGVLGWSPRADKPGGGSGGRERCQNQSTAEVPLGAVLNL